jgi:hypothetical protein
MTRRDDAQPGKRVRVERGTTATEWQAGSVLHARRQAAHSHGRRSPRHRPSGARATGARCSSGTCAPLVADFATDAARWLERFETMVGVGERRVRTLESHRYHLDHHLVPALGRRHIASITVDGQPVVPTGGERASAPGSSSAASTRPGADRSPANRVRAALPATDRDRALQGHAGSLSCLR